MAQAFRSLRGAVVFCSLLVLPACGGSGDSGSNSGGQGGLTGQAGASGGKGGAAGKGGSTAAGGQGGGLGSASEWSDRCQGVVDHNATCAKGSADAAAVDDCAASRTCAPAVWSTDVVDSIMSCLATLPCEQPDDDCISALESQISPVTLDLFAACSDKAAACPGFAGCLETTFLVSDALAEKLQACLAQDCDAASTCMSGEYLAALTDAGCSGELPFGG